MTSLLNKRSGTQFYDWKPMRSIMDILHKNFQEDQLNSRRFPGFPGGFLNSSRFPGFPGVVDTLSSLTFDSHLPARTENGGGDTF